MSVRIVVASQAEASFYDLELPTDELHPVGRLEDPKAHLHDRDLKSDRPGRVFDHAAAAGHRRGATAHHATGGERRPRKLEAEAFAQRIAGALEEAERERRFERLIVIAGPAFLGLLRAALPAAVRARVVAEVPKDLAHEPLSSVRAHLPAAALHRPP